MGSWVASMPPVDVITRTTFHPIPEALIVVTLGWYLLSVRRLSSAGRPWPPLRTAAFCFAELLVAAGFASGLDAFGNQFTVHAIQQMLGAIAAPIFFALSAPVSLALASTGKGTQVTILDALSSGVARVVLHPLVTWLLYAGSLFGLYLSGLYGDTLRDRAANDLVFVELVAVGLLFWWPAVGVDPLPYRLGYFLRMFYLIMLMPLHTILGMALESQTTTIAHGITLNDLHLGGGLLWFAGETVGLLGTIAVFVQWLRADEQAAKRADSLGVPAAARQLAHWRAVRDAAARAASR